MDIFPDPVAANSSSRIPTRSASSSSTAILCFSTHHSLKLGVRDSNSISSTWSSWRSSNSATMEASSESSSSKTFANFGVSLLSSSSIAARSSNICDGNAASMCMKIGAVLSIPLGRSSLSARNPSSFVFTRDKCEAEDHSGRRCMSWLIRFWDVECRW